MLHEPDAGHGLGASRPRPGRRADAAVEQLANASAQGLPVWEEWLHLLPKARTAADVAALIEFLALSACNGLPS